MKQLKTIKFPGIDDTYYVPEYDLTPYATNQSVQEQIGAIELLPGPAGKDGEDYVLTDEDKAEIAGMVKVNADLTNYYTKSEIEALIAASIPASGEEVSY